MTPGDSRRKGLFSEAHRLDVLGVSGLQMKKLGYRWCMKHSGWYKVTAWLPKCPACNAERIKFS